MNTLNKLLDKAREMCGSDLATAARLHVSRSAVSKWRKGMKIDPAPLARLIELTHQDPALAVQVLTEQEADPAEVRLWGALWDRLSPATTAVVGVLLLAGSVLPSPAIGGPLKASYDGGSSSAMHIMLWVRRLRRMLTGRGRGWHAASGWA